MLKADKELVIFPILSGIGLLFVGAAFAVPMFAAGVFDRLATGQGGSDGPLTILVALLFYWAISASAWCSPCCSWW